MRNKDTLRLTLCFFLFVSLLAPSKAQEWKNELKRELVSVNDGKLLIDEYTLITFKGGNSIQLSVHSEAPDDGSISRDNFVAIYSIFNYEFIQSMMGEAGLTEADYSTKTIDALKGDADISLSCVMDDAGMLVDVTTAEGTEQFSQKWADIFE